MTKETIAKDDGRLLTYYRFGRGLKDAETRRRADAATRKRRLPK